MTKQIPALRIAAASKKFGVTHEALIAAVKKVGVMADAVEGELKQTSH